MARIVIYTGYGSKESEWNARSLTDTGLGGTETAVVYVASVLAKYHTVFVVGSNVIDEVVDGVQYQNTDSFFSNNLLIFDTVIGVSYLHFVHLFKLHNAQVDEYVLWQHNTSPYLWFEGETMDNQTQLDTYERLDSIWVPSDWAKYHCIDKQYQSKTVVVPNGINSAELPQINIKKFENIDHLHVIWSSCVSRNLSFVLHVWSTFTHLCPNVTLHICHPEYSERVDPNVMHHVKTLSEQPDKKIQYHGSLSKDELYALMNKCHVWLYPTNYEETFCITALEMISMGVLPCTTNLANLNSFNRLHFDPSCSLGEWNDNRIPTITRLCLQFLMNVYSGVMFNETAQVKHISHLSEQARSEFDWDVIGQHVNDCIKNNFVLKPTRLVERIYIISSDYEAVDQQRVPNHLINRLRRLGLSDIRPHMVPAVDGRLVTPELLERHNIQIYNWKLPDSPNSWWNRDMTPGEIGCVLSHLYCWYHAHINNVDGILVLEEDFYPVKPFHNIVDEDTVPTDWDLLYLGRNKLDNDTDFGHDSLVKPGYSYNAHSYMLSKKGIKNLIDFNFRNKLMPTDELLPATYCNHPREDLSFIWKDVIAYAPKHDDGLVEQRSHDHMKLSSTTHGLTVEPDLDRVIKSLTLISGYQDATVDEPQSNVNVVDEQPHDGTPTRTEVTLFDYFTNKQERLRKYVCASVVNKEWELIIDHPHDGTPTRTEVTLFDYFTNKQEWLRKYVCASVVNKEWELIIDHPIPGVACFNMFKPIFCEELIRAAEQANIWTVARHEFYPTTDFLLTDLGLGEIYQDLLKQYIYPAMIHFYGLEGRSWKNISSEDFMARYTPNDQAHLALHHDHSDITALVNLSKPTDYSGGGTYFHLYKTTHIGIQGQITLHPGRVSHRHGGRPVLEGKRYILVSFIKGDHT